MTKIGLKQGLGLVALVAALPSLALATPGRSLPRGEEHPAVLEKLYSTPIGEVQFTNAGAAGYGGFLRNARGMLVSFSEVRGPAACEAWFKSSKDDPVPGDCEFLFYDETDGRFLSVRSAEMEEASLFEAARGKLRGAYVAL